MINFTRKRSTSQFPYSLGDSSLSMCSPYKYIGAHLRSNLSWVTHINTVTSDASPNLGYIKRNLKTTPDHLRKLALGTCGRPKLEFASAIWRPHQKYLATRIKAVKIQNRATRVLTSPYSFEITVSLLKRR